MFFLLYRHTDDGVLRIFRRFLTTFRRFPRILQNLFEGHTNVVKHFPKISEEFRKCPKLPKTFKKDPKMFRSYTDELKDYLRDKLDISEIIDIFTSEVMENTPPNVDPHEFYKWCIFQ